jgi:hypothetical protein
MVSSASAAPVLSVGSNANYQLNASIQSTQSCNATPVSYNQTACGAVHAVNQVYVNQLFTCSDGWVLDVEASCSGSNPGAGAYGLFGGGIMHLPFSFASLQNAGSVEMRFRDVIGAANGGTGNVALKLMFTNSSTYEPVAKGAIMAALWITHFTNGVVDGYSTRVYSFDPAGHIAQIKSGTPGTDRVCADSAGTNSYVNLKIDPANGIASDCFSDGVINAGESTGWAAMPANWYRGMDIRASCVWDGTVTGVGCGWGGNGATDFNLYVFASESSSPSTPPSHSFMPTISLAGSVNWTVTGLDNNVAVLNVSHRVSIIASVGPLSFTLATEKGSFPKSIDLSTRVESSGTAASVIPNVVERILAYLGSHGYGYNPALSQLLSDKNKVYTFLWVNGPLTIGQPVQILTGYSSVTGSEIVSLGSGNDRNVWIVESEFSRSLSTTTPPMIGSGGSTNSSFKLDLKFDYDQASDLLLRSSTVISMQSSKTQTYNPGDYLCGRSGCFPVADHVTVTHHKSTTIPVTFQLTSTSLDLSKRDPPGSTGTGRASSTSTPATSLWVDAGLGIVGACAAVTLAWLLRRRSRMSAPVTQPGTLKSASPTLTGA